MIVLNLHLHTADLRQSSRVDHALTLVAIPKPVEVTLVITSDFWTILIVAGLILLLFSFAILFCIFMLAHKLIRPIRVLNDKMKEILSTENADNELQEEESSEEITKLYTIFKDLI